MLLSRSFVWYSKRIAEMIRSQDEYDILTELKPLQPSQGANKWWNRETKKNKWDTLEHNGMVFPDAYVPHGVKLRYEGQYHRYHASNHAPPTFMRGNRLAMRARRTFFY